MGRASCWRIGLKNVKERKDGPKSEGDEKRVEVSRMKRKMREMRWAGLRLNTCSLFYFHVRLAISSLSSRPRRTNYFLVTWLECEPLSIVRGLEESP